MITLEITLTDGRVLSGQYDTFKLAGHLAELDRLRGIQEYANLIAMVDFR